MLPSQPIASYVRQMCVRALALTLVLATALCPLQSIAQDSDKAARPDIVIILLDDMRYDQLSSAGHPYIQTPTFDELAKKGVVLDRMYVASPLCGPSRASLLTGRMPSTHGRFNNFIWPDALGGAYLPAVFHKAGYRTALIGKDYEKKSADVYRKEAWDRQFVMAGPSWPAEVKEFTPQQRKAYYDSHLYYDQMYIVDNVNQKVMGYQSDVLLDEFKRFALASPEPYFAFVCPFAPHVPWNPSKGRLGKYEGKGVPPRADLDLASLSPAQRKQAAEGHERMAEMIEDVDEALGRVVDALRQAGKLDQTVIIVTSDNGTMLGDRGAMWKQKPYEMCQRVPMIWYGPGSERLAKSGALDRPASQADILPTLAALIDEPLPEDELRYGQSLFQPRDSALIMQYPVDPKHKDVVPQSLAWASLVTQRYKLTLRANDPNALDTYLGPAIELFDLTKDPNEQHNLADTDPDGVLPSLQKELKEQLEANHAAIQLAK